MNEHLTIFTTHIGRHGRLLTFVAFLAMVLFPFGWLGEQWLPFGELLGAIFQTAREHAIGHTILFCLLGVAILLVFPKLHTQPWRYLGFMLVFGVGQELLQLLYKRRSLVLDDVRDLVTDLAGALLALALVRIIVHRR